MDPGAATYTSQNWIVPRSECSMFPTPDLYLGSLDFSRDLYAPWEPEYKVFEIVWAARDAALMAFGDWDDDDTCADTSSERAFSVLDSPSSSARALSIDRAPSPGHARGEGHTGRTNGKSRKRKALPEDSFSEGARSRKRIKAAAHETATNEAQTDAAEGSRSRPTLPVEVKASQESTIEFNEDHGEDYLLTEVPPVEGIPSTSARPSARLAKEVGLLILPVEEEAGEESAEPGGSTREGGGEAHESSGGDGKAHEEEARIESSGSRDVGNDAGDGASNKDEKSQKNKRRFLCEVHNKLFSDQSSFSRHRRTIKGHPQYQGKVKCEWCDTTVSRGDAMKRHLSDTCPSRHRGLVG